MKFVFLFLSLWILPFTAHAATTYDALLLSVSSSPTLSPGESSQVMVTLKNTGSLLWSREGKNFVSLYHWDPQKKVEVASALTNEQWETDRRVSRPDTVVRPGESITLTFTIRAPLIPGTYREEFILAAENAAWIKNSRFTLEVQVKDGVASQASPSSTLPTSYFLHPTSSPDWSGELVDQGGSEWQIDVEEHVLVTLAFKNTGSKIWMRDGTNLVSLYATDGLTARKSLFKDFHWLSATRAVKLKEAGVKPGEVGHFLLELRAPRAPGAYQETFSLAAEGTAPTWIKGASVTLPIRVPLTSEFIATAPPGQDMTSPPASPQPPGIPPEASLAREAGGPPEASLAREAGGPPGTYATSLLLRSVRDVALVGGTRQTITLGFKNTGTGAWNSRAVRVASVSSASAGSSASVRDESWANPEEVTRVSGPTKPGEIGFVTFQIKAPARHGTYTARFQLYVDDALAEGGTFDLPLTVTADGANVTDSGTVTPTPGLLVVPLGGDVSSLPNEPLIRVGLFKTTNDQMIVRAKYAPASVMQNGAALCHLSLGQLVTVKFDRANRVYKIVGDGSCVGQSTDPYVVRADDGISPLEIADFNRPIAWLAGSNDNTFRSTLELRYSPSTNNLWVINELPLEMYLRGIAETSDQSPYEYQKALLTAARTYAMYHLTRTRKHATEFFTVDAQLDQVYRGYGAEARGPSITSAVDMTRSQIVTYQEKLAITPYYSRSDGRTRAWTEVWGGGPFPWLVSVPVPWDQGRTLWGHGVGMSATGALGMARDGKKYDEILKYFYQGTDLRRAYK